MYGNYVAFQIERTLQQSSDKSMLASLGASLVRMRSIEENIEKIKLKISPLVKIVEIRHVACMGQGLGHHQNFS